jgi:hypothetical protein
MFPSESSKASTPKLTPIEEQRRNELTEEFINLLPNYRGCRLELGRIARELKPLYVRAGRKGGWSRFVTSQGHKVRTVDEWITDYERDKGLRKAPVKKRVKQPKKGSRGNVAESATLADLHVDLSGKPFKDKKEIVEAIFVLTAEEKRKFIDAVNRLGPEESTRRMYEAISDEKKPVQSVRLIQYSELRDAVARHLPTKKASE